MVNSANRRMLGMHVSESRRGRPNIAQPNIAQTNIAQRRAAD